jgi:hypothetical protein
VTGRRQLWRWPPPAPGPALLSFTIYFSLSTLIGEIYPFSRYEMYAYTGYLRGAVLVVESDGVAADIRDFEAFVDVDPSELRYPQGENYGQVYLLDVLRHYVATHQATTHEAAREATRRGARVPVRIGYRVVHATADGPQVEDEVRVLAEGSAWQSD